MYKIVFLLAIFTAMFASIAEAQDYEFSIRIGNFPEREIMLGHYMGEDVVITDTIRLDKRGRGRFEGEDALQQGMYLIYLPQHSYFEFIVGVDQRFTITTDTLNLGENLKISGSAENDVFLDFMNFIRQKTSEAALIQASTIEGTTEEEVQTKMEKLSKDVNMYRRSLVSKSEGTFVSAFICSTIEVEIPDNLANESMEAQFLYYRQHFFDNLDFTDERLLRTPVFMSKVITFFDDILPQEPDTIKGELDKILSSADGNEMMYKYLIGNLQNHYSQSQPLWYEHVFIYLAEKYYLAGKTPWSSQDFLGRLAKRVAALKPCLVGETAHELKMRRLPTDTTSRPSILQALTAAETAGAGIAQDSILPQTVKINKYVEVWDKFLEQTEEYVSLQQVEAQYTILWFWEASCSHCVIETPKLKAVYDKYKAKGVEVFAVNIEPAEFLVVSDYFDKEWENWYKYMRLTRTWLNFVAEHEMDWINVWDPYHETAFRDFYDIKATPALFLLDSNKQILVKNISVEQIDSILGALLVE